MDIQNFKAEFKKTFIYDMLCETLEDEQLFEHTIVGNQVIWMKEQTRQMWSMWQAAKANAVPNDIEVTYTPLYRVVQEPSNEIKQIRQAALVKKDCERSTPVDHKALFTEQQLEKLGYFVADAIEKICEKVANRPEVKHSETMYLGDLSWSQTKLDSYIALCNEEIMYADRQNELIAELSAYDQRGNPNAYCAEEKLVTYSVVIKEK